LRGDDEHHGAAHFVFHAGDVHQMLRGLGLGDGAEGETVVGEGCEVGGQRAVVFYDVVAEEDGVAGALVVIVIHGEVGDGAGVVIGPVLRALGGENGVLDGEDEVSAGDQPLGDALHEGGIVSDVVQGEGAEDDVHAVVWKREVFHGDTLVGDVGEGVLLTGDAEHFFGDIDAEDAFCAVLGGIGTMPAIAAAEVEHALICEGGKEPLEGCPFACAVQTELGAGHLGVLVEESGVVVVVLFHGGLFGGRGGGGRTSSVRLAALA